MRYFLACVLALVCLTASADIVAPTRTTAYDFQCQSADGTKLSDHQRIELAMVACLNNPAGAYIQGGRYRVNRVVVSPTGQASLSWVPPTQNTDGSAAVLTGYRIHYGTSATALTQTIQVANPSLRTYIVEGLLPATYYFAVKAYTANAESSLSNIAQKTIL